MRVIFKNYWGLNDPFGPLTLRHCDAKSAPRTLETRAAKKAKLNVA